MYESSDQVLNRWSLEIDLFIISLPTIPDRKIIGDEFVELGNELLLGAVLIVVNLYGSLKGRNPCTRSAPTRIPCWYESPGLQLIEADWGLIPLTVSSTHQSELEFQEFDFIFESYSEKKRTKRDQQQMIRLTDVKTRSEAVQHETM